MNGMGRARGRHNGGGKRQGYNFRLVNDTLNNRIVDRNLHTHDRCTNVDSMQNTAGATPFDEEQSRQPATDISTSECHPSTRRYFLENPDKDEQENLSMSDSSSSRKSYSLPAWIDDSSITSSVGAAPSDEERSIVTPKNKSATDTGMSSRSSLSDDYVTSSQTERDSAPEGRLIDSEFGSLTNSRFQDDREQRLQALIEYYSFKTANTGEESAQCTTQKQSNSCYDDQTTIERGKEVTYRDFVDEASFALVGNKQDVLKRRSRMPEFQRFVKHNITMRVPDHDDTSESEEEPCNYDYYFSSGMSSDVLVNNTKQRRNQNKEKIYSIPIRSASPDGTSHAASSDGSFSSDESSIAIDPVHGSGCADQSNLMDYYDCGGGVTANSIILSNCERPSYKAADDDDFCSFCPATLPSFDEEEADVESTATTTLCNWTDIKFFSFLLMAYAGNVLCHRSSSSSRA